MDRKCDFKYRSIEFIDSFDPLLGYESTTHVHVMIMIHNKEYKHSLIIQNTTKQQYKSITINRNDLNLAYAKHKYTIIQYDKHT